MTHRNLIQRSLNAASKIAGALQFAAPLMTRLLVGVAFFYTGQGKLQNLDRTTAFFTDLGVPFAAANALFISSLELVGGICLMLGLGTRFFSMLLSSTMIVALLTADKANFVGKFPAELTDVSPVVLLVFLIWLALYGPGRVSLDWLLGKRFGPQQRAAA